MTNWKVAERRVAALLGGQRVPVSGRARGDAPDIAHEWLSVECKARRQLPDWLLDAMAQARAAAKADQLPIVVLHEHGTRYDHAMVMFRLDEFWLLFGDGPGADDLSQEMAEAIVDGVQRAIREPAA